jgi:hypothetical protein
MARMTERPKRVSVRYRGCWRLRATPLDEGGSAVGSRRCSRTVHSNMRAINHFPGWAGREGQQVSAEAQLLRQVVVQEPVWGRGVGAGDDGAQSPT